MNLHDPAWGDSWEHVLDRWLGPSPTLWRKAKVLAMVLGAIAAGGLLTGWYRLLYKLSGGRWGF